MSKKAMKSPSVMNHQLKQVACGLSGRPSHDRAHDGTPTDVHGSVKVRVGLKAARLAEEVVSTLAVGLLAMSALATSARSIARIDRLRNDARKPSLVRDKQPKLGERPFGVPGSLRPSQPIADSLPDAFEVFQTYSPAGLFRLAYQRLADAVVRVAFATPLAVRQFLEMPLSRGGADKLDNLALACPGCNCAKGSKPSEEYRLWLSEIERAIRHCERGECA